MGIDQTFQLKSVCTVACSVMSHCNNYVKCNIHINNYFQVDGGIIE